MILKEEERQKKIDRFNDAMHKMSQVSLAYQQGRLKHMAYAEQIDALIDASSWTREAFQMEVERRHKQLASR